jgi:hypothetical protein
MNDKQEAQVVLARLLMDKIRTDKYPSSTQMDLLEQMIPRRLALEYFDVLLEKVAADQFPSVSLMTRRRCSRGTPGTRPSRGGSPLLADGTDELGLAHLRAPVDFQARRLAAELLNRHRARATPGAAGGTALASGRLGPLATER